MHVSVNPIAQIWHMRENGGVTGITVTHAGLAFTGSRSDAYLGFRETDGTCHVRLETLWARMTFGFRSGRSLTLRGLGKTEAQQFRGEYLRLRREYFAYEAFLTELPLSEKKLKAAEEAIEAFEAAASYITVSDRNAFVARFEDRFWKADVARGIPDTSHGKRFRKIREYVSEAESRRAFLNDTLVKTEVSKYGPLFDSIDRKPLTEEQRKACVVDEDRQRIVAGAGCGKTSTLRAKAAYLVASGRAKSCDVVAVSYSRKSASELAERFQANPLTADIEVTTVHALANRLIGRITGRKPSLTSLAEDEQLLRFMQSTLEDLIREEKSDSGVIEFLAYCLRPYKPAHSFVSPGQYYDYLRNVELLTLSGERVKSFEEAEIANFLFLNGIAYEYERPYEHDVAAPDFRQYKPDFYLPEHGVYIEHFGIMRDGSTAPGVDPVRYADGMAWKRDLHQRFGTKLLETYSYDRVEGALITRLADLLKGAGVAESPRPAGAILETLNATGTVSYAARLFSDFISLFKEVHADYEGVRERLAALEPLRGNAFMRVFGALHQRYERTLSSRNEIDYADMLHQCAALLSAGASTPYKYVLVDELQDMSEGKAAFVAALLSSSPGCKLVGVGDDWQAIYRFNGCDVALFTRFSERFGESATSVLTNTFRLNDSLANVSEKFILANSSQIPKTLHAEKRRDGPSVIVTHRSDAGGIMDILREIQRKAPASHVLIVARTNAGLPAQLPDSTLRISCSTAHGSKGCEADYVIVLHADRSEDGFPSLKIGDPFLEALLPAGEAYPFAEERRLFYVALTRTRNDTYIACTKSTASDFVRELVAYGADLVHIADCTSPQSSEEVAVHCRACVEGIYVKRNGRSGVFWGCSNFPYCEETSRGCPQCDACIRFDGDFYRCSREACDYRERRCPRCERGVVRVRRNATTGREFWGCSYWRPDNSGCHYTAPLAAGST